MIKNCWLIILLFVLSCSKKQEDKSDGNFTHEDILSIEQSSLSNLENLVYEGDFSGTFYDKKISLKLKDNGKYVVNYNEKEIKGDWFKKDDGSMIELDSRKSLPFQFLVWSDNNILMILNMDGKADEEGKNYLTRIAE